MRGSSGRALLVAVAALLVVGWFWLDPGSDGSGDPVADDTLRESATVQRVVDGDTLVLQDRRRVRVLGIDTPEAARDGRAAECGADAATAAARGAVEGRRVVLEADASQADADRFDRLLRYVQAPDGRDLGEGLLAEGHARVYAPAGDVARQETYEALEADARRSGKGHWAC